MKTGTLSFDILDFWHCGAGHGAGRYLDATVVRDEDRLPYIPGRTVKGLLRKAVRSCETFGHLPPKTTATLFGTRGTPSQPVADSELPDGDDDGSTNNTGGNPGTNETNRQSRGEALRYATERGCLRVSNAELPEEWKTYFRSEEGRELVDAFYDDLASTALDSDGVARGQSLRRIEVTVPLELTARWEIVGDRARELSEYLGKALPMLRKLGASRHRGLGRVRVAIQNRSGEDAAETTDDDGTGGAQ